ncbi:hypothetical protein [Nevskia ramosa]|uniref:hypothetical protein n=1 Tax=Nevskia ramosa TaxID=64002 RepID=UPI0003B5F2A2|nr:hypothetical protein [Nevskia ramosa]
MLRSFIADDIYRVTLGSDAIEPLSRTLGDHGLRPDGTLRRMHRDDGTGVWMAQVLVDGNTLQHIALQARLMLMQIDNISARLRAAPELPGSVGECAVDYAPNPHFFGVVA